jgi:hypothetical protein
MQVTLVRCFPTMSESTADNDYASELTKEDIKALEKAGKEGESGLTLNKFLHRLGIATFAGIAFVGFSQVAGLDLW